MVALKSQQSLANNNAQAFSLYSIFGCAKEHPFVTTILFGTATFFGYKKISSKYHEIQMKKAAAQLPDINIYIPYHLKSDGGYTEYAQWGPETKKEFWKEKPNPAIDFYDRNNLGNAEHTERNFFIEFKNNLDLAKTLQLSLEESSKNQPFKSTITNLNSMEQN